MTEFGGLTHKQRDLMDLLCGVLGNEQAFTRETGIQLGKEWTPIVSELVGRGLVATEPKVDMPRYWLTGAGLVMCGNLAWHREYNRRAPPGWRT